MPEFNSLQATLPAYDYEDILASALYLAVDFRDGKSTFAQLLTGTQITQFKWMSETKFYLVYRQQAQNR